MDLAVVKTGCTGRRCSSREREPSLEGRAAGGKVSRPLGEESGGQGNTVGREKSLAVEI